MNKLGTGLIAGGILGAAGVTAALSSKKSRRKMMKNGKKVIDSAAEAMDDVRSKIW